MFRRSLKFCGAPILSQICAGHLKDIEAAGTYKHERVITSAQQAEITVSTCKTPVLNFCANNYLGLSNNKEIVAAAAEALTTRGFGLSSVRFICGTQDLHKQLENDLSKWLGRQDTILFPSCFDANAALFETILTHEDVVISDALNHASIIDGVRLCKAERKVFKHMDIAELEGILKATQNKRMRLIATDGVFSMDGDIAPLDKICQLADQYNANVFVDDSHATGFIGAGGKGTPSLFGVQDKVDILNSTLGKAMGGASGGFSSGCKELVALQRQRGRPYLFSNSVAPAVVAGCIKALQLLQHSSEAQKQLNENTKVFRGEMKKAGFTILGHDQCPIVPVLLKEARLASEFADRMLKKDIYVIGFSFPVVPKEQARIRVQLSAAHSKTDVQRAIDAFIDIKKELKI